jgi:transposase
MDYLRQFADAGVAVLVSSAVGRGKDARGRSSCGSDALSLASFRGSSERDPVAVQRWLDEEYSAIKRQAKAENAEIHCGDQMGLRSDQQTGTSYGRRGQTPVIPGTGQRFRCNVLSTITNRGELSFMVFKDNFNGAVFIKFVTRLLRLRQREVLLILDRHPGHRSAEVQRWLARRAARLEVFFLPGYSPDLNPGELLNQDVKSNGLGRQRAATRATDRQRALVPPQHATPTRDRREPLPRRIRPLRGRVELFNVYCSR